MIDRTILGISTSYNNSFFLCQPCFCHSPMYHCPMSRVHFHKYHGTGNDFILVDNRQGQLDFTTEQVRFFCDRHFGIGADGMILLNSHFQYDFEMKYYNSDGYESSMCGNGGRCLVAFAHDLGIHKNRYSFIAIDGEHEAYKKDGWIYLKMQNVSAIEWSEEYACLDTGSPHYIRPVKGIMEYDVKGEGRKVRYSEPFSEAGINVNFVEKFENYIYVRTYERGVEDETLSCGTGVTAAAIVNYHQENGYNKIDIQTPGGKLAVEFKKNGSQMEDVWLCGPAAFVFDGFVECTPS